MAGFDQSLRSLFFYDMIILALQSKVLVAYFFKSPFEKVDLDGFQPVVNKSSDLTLPTVN